MHNATILCYNEEEDIYSSIRIRTFGSWTQARCSGGNDSFVTPQHIIILTIKGPLMISPHITVFFLNHIYNVSMSSYQAKESTVQYTNDFSSSLPSHIEQQLHEVREYTIQQFESSRMMVSETQAKLLNQLIKVVHAKRVLEIGTYTGYSAIAQAAALPPNGKMITLDINEATQAIARRFLEKANVLDKVELQLAPAADR